jgi:hypothetical protein
MLPLIVGAGASLLGSALSFLGAKSAQNSTERLQNQQLDHSDTAATVAYQRQRELIDQQNLYNSPVQQMERYRAAGLNPYLMYGQGGGTVSAATANVQQANTPSVTYQPNYMQGVGESVARGVSETIANIISMKRLENETKLADAQSENLRAQAGLTQSNARFQNETFNERVQLQRYETLFREAQISDVQQSAMLKDVEREFYDWKKANMSASTEQIQAQKEYLTTQASSQKILNQYLPKQQAAQLSKTLAEARKAYLEGDYTKVQTSLAGYIAETQRITAEANRTNANTGVRNYIETVRKNDADHDISRQKNKIEWDKAYTLRQGLTKITQKDLYNTLSNLLTKTFEKSMNQSTPISISGFQ